MTFTLPPGESRPSRLSLDGREVALAADWFDFDDPNYDLLPAVRFDGEWALTDGHTRAFLAVPAGADRLRVREDEDADDLPLDAYRTCVRWCDDVGVTEIRDLLGRAVNADTFEEK